MALQLNQPTASTASTQGRDVDAIIARLSRECGDRPPDGVLAMRWLEDRYRQVWGAASWQFTRKEDLIQTVDDIVADSVTVTNASATVTETTSTGKWTSAVVDRFFRRTGDNQYYKISSFSNLNPDTITLNRVYEGTTGTAVGYRIFQNIYSLNNEVGVIEGFVSLKDSFSLIDVNQEWLDRSYPNRPTVGIPRYWAPAGRDSNDIYQVELYPIPDAAYGMLYHYTQEAPYITGGEAKTIPQVFESLLRHGWKADYWRWRASMDDSRGNEFVYAAQEEMLFSKELNEMVSREFQNDPPHRLRLAGRYIGHRALRGNKWRIEHSKSELP